VLKAFRRIIAKRLPRGNAGVVYHYVQRAEFGNDFVHGGFHFIVFGNVRRHAYNGPVRVFFFQLLQRLANRFAAAAEQRHVRAVFQKRPYYRKTDTPCAAGNDGGFSLQHNASSCQLFPRRFTALIYQFLYAHYILF